MIIHHKNITTTTILLFLWFIALNLITINATSYDADIIRSCNDNQQIYIPFYYNPQTSTTTEGSSSTTNSISSDLDSILNQPSSSRVCFSCREVIQIPNHERSKILQQYSTCSTDEDCTLVYAETPFQGNCAFASNNDGSIVLNNWADQWKKLMDDTNQLEFHHNVCGYASPSCMVQTAKCIQNSCQAVVEDYIQHYENIETGHHGNNE